MFHTSQTTSLCSSSLVMNVGETRQIIRASNGLPRGLTVVTTDLENLSPATLLTLIIAFIIRSTYNARFENVRTINFKHLITYFVWKSVVGGLGFERFRSFVVLHRVFVVSHCPFAVSHRFLVISQFRCLAISHPPSHRSSAVLQSRCFAVSIFVLYRTFVVSYFRCFVHSLFRTFVVSYLDAMVNDGVPITRHTSSSG